TGGNGPDTFVFGANFGANTITDFDVNIDAFQFDKSLFGSVSDVTNHITDSSAGAVISDDFGDTVTLNGVTAAQLAAHSNDFHLVGTDLVRGAWPCDFDWGHIDLCLFRLPTRAATSASMR